MTRKEKAEKLRMQKFDATVSEYFEAWRIGKISSNQMTLMIIDLINKERNPYLKRLMAMELMPTFGFKTVEE